jgi:hypothetical protein
MLRSAVTTINKSITDIVRLHINSIAVAITLKNKNTKFLSTVKFNINASSLSR